MALNWRWIGEARVFVSFALSSNSLISYLMMMCNAVRIRCVLKKKRICVQPARNAHRIKPIEKANAQKLKLVVVLRNPTIEKKKKRVYDRFLSSDAHVF